MLSCICTMYVRCFTFICLSLNGVLNGFQGFCYSLPTISFYTKSFPIMLLLFVVHNITHSYLGNIEMQSKTSYTKDVRWNVLKKKKKRIRVPKIMLFGVRIDAFSLGYVE